MARKLSTKIFNTSKKSSPAQKGGVGYDNSRENIDPHIKTKVVSAKEIYGDISTAHGYTLQQAYDAEAGSDRIVLTSVGDIIWKINTHDSFIIRDEGNSTDVFQVLGGTIPQATLNITHLALTAQAADISMNSNKITNVTDPTANQDAATKKYVDDNAGGAPGGNDTEVQFNDGGNFGASAKLMFDGNDLIFGTTSGDQILLYSGYVTQPTLSFQSDPDTGIWLQGTGSIGFTIGGNEALRIRNGQLGAADRSSTPGYSFQEDSDSGIGSAVPDTMYLKAGGIEFVELQEKSAQDVIVFNEDGRDIDLRVETDDEANMLFIDGANNAVGIGTATPTQPFSVKEKCCMTAIGGFAIKLTNTTGATSVIGQTVKADPATDDAVILTAANDDECIGVFLDAVADDAEAWVVVAGIADVAMEDNTAATRGNWVSTGNSEVGYANATLVTPAAAPTHFEEIGHCIESVAAGGGGTHILARCVLHFN